MAQKHLEISKADGNIFGVLLVLTAFYVVFICFGGFLLHYVLLFLLVGIGLIAGFFYISKWKGSTPTFLTFRPPYEYDQEKKPQLNKYSIIIIGLFATRLFIAILVYFDVNFLFVILGLTIIDLVNGKIIILMGKSMFWDRLDNEIDIVSRLIAVIPYAYIWWVNLTIVIQWSVYIARIVDVRYIWLRTFPPDVLWLVYGYIQLNGMAMFIICLIIFTLNLFSYALLTGRNGVLLRPS